MEKKNTQKNRRPVRENTDMQKKKEKEELRKSYALRESKTNYG